MKPRPTSHILALLLCVVALLAAQTFGSQYHFVCDCGGKLVVTKSSHCHGPNHANCHGNGDSADSPHSEKDSGERKDHQLVNNEVQLRPVDTMHQVVAPPVLIATLPVVQALISAVQPRVPVFDQVDLADSPPPGVTVARTLVLLI